MENIDSIIFDLGGVIINLDNQITENAFSAMGAKDFRKFFGHGFAASFFRDYELGKISDQQFIDDLQKMIDVKVPDEMIISAWNALLLDFPPERITLLKELQKNYRLFLFSNTNSLHLEALQKIYRDSFATGSLDDLFERAYYSHILRLRKPDREGYEWIIRENQLDPQRTMFVDDAWVNIEGANATGLRGYWLEPGKTILDIEW